MIAHAAIEILLVAATLAVVIFILIPSLREIWYLLGRQREARELREREDDWATWHMMGQQREDEARELRERRKR